MRVIDGIEEPFDILFACNDTRKSQDLEWRVVRMYTHIDAILLTYWHYGSKEISHILAKLVSCDALILLQQSLEYRYRIEVSLLDVSVDKSLGLDDDGINEIVLFSLCNDFIKFLDLSENLRLIISLSTLASKNLDIKICKTCIIKVKR